MKKTPLLREFVLKIREMGVRYINVETWQKDVRIGLGIVAASFLFVMLSQPCRRQAQPKQGEQKDIADSPTRRESPKIVNSELRM